VFVGVGTIGVVIVMRRINAGLRRRGFRFPIPQHLVAIVVMAALVWALELHRQGVQIVGPVPSSLPSFRLPELRWEQARLLAGSAFAIALLGLLEALAMAKAIAARTGQQLDVNQQCLSEGAANLTGGFFQCFPGSGSLTRSVVNQQAGAVSQWSGVVSAAAVAATIFFFAPLASFIPRASLAGLLVLAAYRMVDGAQLFFHLRATRFDAGVVAATALAAVFISVEFCIVIGVFLSFVLYVPKAAQVRLVALTVTREGGLRDRRAETTSDNRLIAFALDGELFFGAEVELTKHFATISEASRGDVRAVILVLDRGRNPDAGFLRLVRELHETLRSRNVLLLLCGVHAQLMSSLNSTGLSEAIGPERIFPPADAGSSCATEAIRLAFRLLGDTSLLEFVRPENCLTTSQPDAAADPHAT
jgi:SulP family sulfate permease